MSNFYLSDVFEDVSEEGQRAREKFGEQSDSSDERWLAILMEEVGEAATEVLRVGNPGLDALQLDALRALYGVKTTAHLAALVFREKGDIFTLPRPGLPCARCSAPDGAARSSPSRDRPGRARP